MRHSRFLTPDWSKFPGGHRIRVTPVPIPNTEVKPDTADGTACAGVWESRSLPGLFIARTLTGVLKLKPVVRNHSGLFVCTAFLGFGAWGVEFRALGSGFSG